MDRQEHWSQIYQTRSSDDVSWYQARPAVSLKLIDATGIGKDHGIIDAGGGASVLVDFLLEAGFTKLEVLDIAATALEHSKRRLGARLATLSGLRPISPRSSRRTHSTSGTTAPSSIF